MITSRATLIGLSLLLISLSASAGVFKGSPTRVSGSTMAIRWETSDETGVVAFVVVRKEYRPGNVEPWGPAEEVGTVAASGRPGVYTIEDAGVFKSADRFLQYEIRAVAHDGRVIESVPMTTVLTSGVTSAMKRTWGSIKAMFR